MLGLFVELVARNGDKKKFVGATMFRRILLDRIVEYCAPASEAARLQVVSETVLTTSASEYDGLIIKISAPETSIQIRHPNDARKALNRLKASLVDELRLLEAMGITAANLRITYQLLNGAV